MRVTSFSIISFISAFLILSFAATNAYSNKKPETVHVIVALYDSRHQAIGPVPEKLADGNDPERNLYWGALYGVKTFFKNDKNWTFLKSLNPTEDHILERIVFKHKRYNAYLIADAYRGKEIKKAVQDFLLNAAAQKKEEVEIKIGGNAQKLNTGSGSNLLVYIGHNGLLDFTLPDYPEKVDNNKREVIILACYARQLFTGPLKKAGAYPLLWTKEKLSPEAYILSAALEARLSGAEFNVIRREAAKAYARYQKSSLKSAEFIFVTGW
jgi:hypothetical protein